MVSVTKIFLESATDYKRKIAHKVPFTHIDKYVISDLESTIGDRCKAVAIEYPYYESDYLSNFYTFYAKKQQQFPKESCRLLFFSDKKASELIGYVSLRPTCERTRCGRTYLEPQYIINNPAYILLSNCKIHFRGGEAIIRAFPHMKQEGDVSVCAHVALWAVLRSFTNRFHDYPEIRLGDLVNMIQPLSERPTPSKGLTPTQVSDVLLSQGLSPIIREKPRLGNRDDEFFDEIISYLDSGVPVIGFMRAREHAITLIGHGKIASPSQLRWIPDNYYEIGYDKDGAARKTNVILASKFVSFAVINDDNYLPYREVSRTVDTAGGHYSMHDIDYAVIPLYPRIQLAFNDVREKFLALLPLGYYDWVGQENLIVRFFITSANSYREYAQENIRALGPDLVNVILGIEMPRFIWCVEISSRLAFEEDLVNAIVLIDSTCATINSDPFLLLTSPNWIKYKSTADYVEEYDPVTEKTEFLNYQEITEGISLLTVPAFHKNLEEVIPYGKT